MKIEVREFVDSDCDGVWAIMEPIIRAGETYALPVDWDRDSALRYWCDPSHTVFVAVESAEEEGTNRIVGTYFLHANQKGNGSHVSNCGYMTLQGFTGRGVARSMCTHSLEEARRRGYKAMQYNFVIQSNERAVRLWQSMGFEMIGKIPQGFHHPSLGFTDVLIMYKFL